MLNRIDQFLIHPPEIKLTGISRFGLEFLWFGIKELRGCLFAGLFFIAMFVVPHGGLFGVARYDLLLLIALTIQIVMVMTFTITLFLKDIKQRIHIPS